MASVVEFKKLDKYNSIEKPKIPIASQKDLLKTYLEILIVKKGWVARYHPVYMQ